MSLYDRLAALALTVEGYGLERRERDTSSGFTRMTTTFDLRGGGTAGRGEDVTYAEADHDALAADPPALPTGEFTFEGFSRALEGRGLFPESPDRAVFRNYRRWAVESAALDLALRQADSDLAGALGRSYRPVRFVVSTRLGETGFARIERLLEVDPDAEFKLDPTPEWSPALAERLADTRRVRVLDLKGLYDGAVDLGVTADPEFYRRIVETFSDAVIEDPVLTAETRPVFEGHEERISWDYPITGLGAVRDLPFEPRWLNVKPSRFGTVQSLLETVEYCRDHGIQLYGGGQFELGVGREHLQTLASLFYPDGPNDVAPGGYNDPSPQPGLPTSPLRAPEEPEGMAWNHSSSR